MTKPAVDLTVAYTAHYEKRWWIFHYVPSGNLVRLLISYPDKMAALRAILLLGYTAIAPSPINAVTERAANEV